MVNTADDSEHWKERILADWWYSGFSGTFDVFFCWMENWHIYIYTHIIFIVLIFIYTI